MRGGRLLSRRRSAMADFERCRHIEHLRRIFESSGNLLFREFGKRCDDSIDAIPGGNVSQYIRHTDARTFNARGSKAYVATCGNAFIHIGIVYRRYNPYKSMRQRGSPRGRPRQCARRPCRIRLAISSAANIETPYRYSGYCEVTPHWVESRFSIPCPMRSCNPVRTSAPSFRSVSITLINCAWIEACFQDRLPPEILRCTASLRRQRSA